MLKKALERFLTKNNFFVTIIIVIGIFSRSVLLGSIPVGLTHDDADVVGSIKTLAYSGVDVSGVSFPSLLSFNRTEGNISGLASYLLSPIFKLVPLNLFSVHLVFVLINLTSLVLLSLFVYKLTEKYKLSIFVFLIGLLNPWFFAYSRYPTEAPVALLFALLGIFFFYTKNKYSLLFSSIFFSLSFYSYYGAKVAILVLFPSLILFELIKNKFTDFKKYILPAFIFLVFVSSYFLISIYNPNSTFNKRMGGEFIFKNLEVYEDQTNKFRQISMDFPLKNLFYNKYLFLTEDIADKYVGWLSPDILFFEGDPFSVYKFSDHGLFYLLDAVLLLSGISYLVLNFKKFKNLTILICAIILIGPIGSSISNVGISYFFRSFLLIPAIIILLGIGLYNLKGFFKYLFLILYIFFFFKFLVFYFARYPVYSQENNYLSERIVSSFINREIILGNKVTVYVSNIESFKNLNNIYSSVSSKNINITNDCKANYNDGILIFDNKLNCSILGRDYLVIQNQKDSGSIFKIYGRNICSQNSLTAYGRNHLISDYNIESLSNSEFCNRWIQNGKTN